MVNVIVFSKDRPLQLEGYLTSLMHYSGIKPEFINVLYRSTNGISYQKLITKYSAINWIEEDSYSNDLKKLIIDANDFILFGCDDVFFKDYFNIDHAVEILRKDDSVFAFHLRLGINIENRPKVEDQKRNLKWKWNETNSMHWNYPWEVSAALYRKADVLRIISVFDFSECKSPNFFEDLIARKIVSKEISIPDYLASFHSGKALTLTVNRVQDDYRNPFDQSSTTSVKELYEYFEDNLYLDWLKFENKINTYIHVDSAYFSLTDTDLSLTKRKGPVFLMGNSVENERTTNVGFGLRVLIFKNMFRRRLIRVINIVNPNILLYLRRIRKKIRNA